MDTNIRLALELMLYGVSGVFFVLIVFFVIVKLLNVIFPYKGENDK